MKMGKMKGNYRSESTMVRVRRAALEDQDDDGSRLGRHEDAGHAGARQGRDALEVVAAAADRAAPEDRGGFPLCGQPRESPCTAMCTVFQALLLGSMSSKCPVRGRA